MKVLVKPLFVAALSASLLFAGVAVVTLLLAARAAGFI
jgi:hypothetical protein